MIKIELGRERCGTACASKWDGIGNEVSPLTTGRKRPLPPVISLGEVRSNRAYQQLLAQLEAFCESLPDDEPWSVDQFFGSDPSDPEMEVFQFAYLDWLAFDYRAWEDGRTVLERFAETAKLDDTAQAMLQAWRGARMGIYQVVAAQGRASVLRDCFTDAEYPIEADSGVEPFSANDLVICRVLPVGDTFHLGYDVRTTATHPVAMVRNAVLHELFRMQRQWPDAAWDDLFKERWPIVHDAVTTALAAASAQPLPAWQTPPSGGGKTPVDGNLYHEAAKVLWEFLTVDDVSYADRQRAMYLWADAAALLKPRTGRVEAWAAGAAYAHLHFALADGTTQGELAEAFGISSSTLATRARAIVDALGLTELDDRYADPFDPRVRFRMQPEPLPLRALAAAVAAGPAEEAAPVQLLLDLQPDDVTTLALLGHSRAAAGDKQEARAYAERAKAAYLRHVPGARGGLLRLVELLGEVGDSEGIWAVTAGEQPGALDGPIVRRMAIAASRDGRPADALALLELASEKGEPVGLVKPFIDVLRLMEAGRVPAYKLDFEEQIDTLLGWGPKLNALTRSHLICAILLGKARDGVEAARALGAQRDPWAGRLLRHLSKQSGLRRTVQDAIEKALRHRE